MWAFQIPEECVITLCGIALVIKQQVVLSSGTPECIWSKESIGKLERSVRD